MANRSADSRRGASAAKEPVIQVRPATSLEDLAIMLGPKRPDATVCWCLSYRGLTKEQRDLRGPERSALAREIYSTDPPPGVLAYRGGDVVGWAAVQPRTNTTFSRSRTIPWLDDLPVWSLWCLRVRPGYRRQGITRDLIAGAVGFARDHGAPAVEAYPVDNRGEKVDPTMAYVGVRQTFERAGFIKAADTTSVLSGFPRVLMRYNLP